MEQSVRKMYGFERIIEPAGEVDVTASAVVSAVQAYSKIDAAGQWIERTEQVSLNDLSIACPLRSSRNTRNRERCRIGSRRLPKLVRGELLARSRRSATSVWWSRVLAFLVFDEMGRNPLYDLIGVVEFGRGLWHLLAT
jgi:hypothetical protein